MIIIAFKHIILGTLLDLPTYGYEMIKKCFRDFTPANPKVNEGRLYTTLKKLDEDGLVSRKVRPQQDIPDQKIISITSAGKEEFYQWLRSQEDESGHDKFDFFNQYPFLTKVDFFQYLEKEVTLDKMRSQLAICDMRLQRFHQARQEMLHKQVDYYRVKIIEYGIDVEELKKSWLKAIIAEQEIKMELMRED